MGRMNAPIEWDSASCLEAVVRRRLAPALPPHCRVGARGALLALTKSTGRRSASCHEAVVRRRLLLAVPRIAAALGPAAPCLPGLRAQAGDLLFVSKRL